MTHLETITLSIHFSTDGDPAAREPARPDQTQWQPVGAPSHHQRRMEWLCPVTDCLLHLHRLILKQATADMDNEHGVYVRYRQDGSHFNYDASKQIPNIR